MQTESNGGVREWPRGAPAGPRGDRVRPLRPEEGPFVFVKARDGSYCPLAPSTTAPTTLARPAGSGRHRRPLRSVVHHLDGVLDESVHHELEHLDGKSLMDRPEAGWDSGRSAGRPPTEFPQDAHT